jgi:nucleoside-diphosphate-sugar epimerase
MKILIAGGAGYLGSVLGPKLLERGYEVDVVDLFWFGNHLPPEIGVIQKDIFEMGIPDLEHYEQVLFLAGLSNDPMAEYAPSQNFTFNAAAPAYLAYVAQKAKVKRYIYANSCTVYGYTDNELFDETRPVSSTHAYGISKLQGEQAVMNLMNDDLSVISLRMGTVCGYSPRMRLDLVINTMFKDAMRNQEITVNNPSIWRPIISMEDASNAYVRAIEASERISGIFNVASGNYTIGEVGDLVKNTLEDQLGLKISLNILDKRDYRNYKVSIQKAENVLSFHPHHDVKRIVQNLIENMEKFKDWDNPLYYNLETLKLIRVGKLRGVAEVSQ